MTDGMRVRCLGDELPEYAAGRLPLDRQWAWDRHLVACQVCGHAVAQERRLRSVLAGAPSMPGDLRSSLLALGTDLASRAGERPAVAHPPALALLAPSAPPCHRSALRATVVAAAAAGVSAAAAWSLTVIGSPATAVRPGIAATTAPSVAPVSAPTTPGPAFGSAVASLGLSRPAVLTRVDEQAESTP
jgi:hypothetical protein